MHLKACTRPLLLLTDQVCPSTTVSIVARTGLILDRRRRARSVRADHGAVSRRQFAREATLARLVDHVVLGGRNLGLSAVALRGLECAHVLHTALGSLPRAEHARARIDQVAHLLRRLYMLDRLQLLGVRSHHVASAARCRPLRSILDLRSGQRL